MPSKSKLSGMGVYLPARRLTNGDLEKMVETSDQWIVQRTGMRERRIAAEDEFASHLAVKAVEDLLSTGASVEDVDMILVSTFTADHFAPSVASLVQGHFGMANAGTLDLGAGCTGFCYALWLADALVTAGQRRKVLVIAAETTSRTADYTDRRTCILFGDAAAACIVERTEGEGCFLGSYFATDGEMAHLITCGSHAPDVNGVPLEQRGIFAQDGPQVYKYVLRHIPEGIHNLLERAGTSMEALDWFVPHSANLRMVEGLCGKLSFPAERTLTSAEYYGNTSSATIPLALWLAEKEGRLQRGDKALLYGFGAGLTHGGVLVQL